MSIAFLISPILEQAIVQSRFQSANYRDRRHQGALAILVATAMLSSTDSG